MIKVVLHRWWNSEDATYQDPYGRIRLSGMSARWVFFNRSSQPAVASHLRIYL